MTAKHPEFHLPDESVLAAHAHWVGDAGSGKQTTLLDALGLSYGDGHGGTYFQSISLETLALFHAKFRDIRSFADLVRYAEGPARDTATGTDGSGHTEPPR